MKLTITACAIVAALATTGVGYKLLREPADGPTAPVLRHHLTPGTADANGHVASWATVESPNSERPPPGGNGYQWTLITWATGHVYERRVVHFRAAWRFIAGSPGRLLDFHTSTHDPSHEGKADGWCSYTKAGACTGVSPIALDWKEGYRTDGAEGLMLTLQPEADDFGHKYHWTVLTEAEMIAYRQEQNWLVLEGEIGIGRPDLAGTRGYAKIKLADESSWRVNIDNVATHWLTDTVVALLQGGGYWNTGPQTEVVNDSAAIQLGPTRERMLADQPVYYGQSGSGSRTSAGTFTYPGT